MTITASCRPSAALAAPTGRSTRPAITSAALASPADDPFRRAKQLAVAAAAAFTLAAGRASAQCPDLISSPSGLQFCDVVEGQGAPPVKGATIKVHYNGRLDSDIASGTFDSSYERGRPLAFAVGTGQVIRGWDAGILGDGSSVPPMLPGGKRQLVIPPDLAYGARGAGGVIPPNATLYFDVELVGRLGKK